MDVPELLEHRRLKFRKIGGFQEGIPVDPKRKVNMKKKTVPVVGKKATLELEDDVEKLKEQILKAKKSATPPEVPLSEMIEKLKREVDHEYSEAVKALGLGERFAALQVEFSKVNSQDQIVNPVLTEKMAKLKEEFKQSLPTAPNYATLKYKLDMLQELSKAQTVSGSNDKSTTLRQEINQKLKEIIGRSDLKQKIESIEAEVQNSGASEFEDLDEVLKEKVSAVKKEIQSEVTNVLKSMGLEVEVIKSKAKELSEQTSYFKQKVEILNSEIRGKLEEAITSSNLKDEIELLKLEITKASKRPDTTSKGKIQALEQQIKQKLSETIVATAALKEKHEEILAELAEAISSPEELDGTLKNDHPKEKDSRVEINVA